MAEQHSKLTQARLKELLHYDPETGIFTRRIRGGGALPGDIAGSGRDGGRVSVCVCGRQYEAGRLAWLYVHGEFPPKDIRRKNKILNDNRIDNFFDPRLPMPKVVHEPLTADRLRELVEYDKDTGVFTRRIVIAKIGKVGDVIGHLNKQRRFEVSVNGKIYLAHRLAWLYMTGEWPTQEIDHIDGNPSNNKFDNLRNISRVGNAQNQRKARANSLTGVLGVRKHNRKWQASITVDGAIIFLGSFPTIELAGQAYVDAKRVLHEGCTL